MSLCVVPFPTFTTILTIFNPFNLKPILTFFKVFNPPLPPFPRGSGPVGGFALPLPLPAAWEGAGAGARGTYRPGPVRSGANRPVVRSSGQSVVWLFGRSGDSVVDRCSRPGPVRSGQGARVTGPIPRTISYCSLSYDLKPACVPELPWLRSGAG